MNSACRCPCPPDLLPHFQRLDAPRDVVRTYLKASRPSTGTVAGLPAFTLGSISRGEFWNQRRGILAYWGTPEQPAYLRCRVLRDGYDFADAQLFTAQRRGDLLAAVTFATDGGNTHIGLDRIKHGRFRAKDLRLRVELGGSAAALKRLCPPRKKAPPRCAPATCGSGSRTVPPLRRAGPALGVRTGERRCAGSISCSMPARSGTST